MKKPFLLGIVLFAISQTGKTEVLDIDSQMADKIVSICKFVKAKGHPEQLRLKGLAWCKVGVDYLPEEYKRQKQLVSHLYESENYKHLLQKNEFISHLKKARRRIAEISLGM
ncbi:hypothetical protein [Kangiella sediminilitoris]|uniref:Uncharacterized protein n=1 Tax=Kangiella sediminilitoris TaxID=1144748 RepID=A0A1B3BA67_9GAMM|nr:hypothetical protein [Kangiella sediminilitoris]AOE49675.1 hypothetical protein KS2013_953 [Kangiella sediminilitoris]